MDYDIIAFTAADLVRLDVLFTTIASMRYPQLCIRSMADRRGRKLVKKLREEIDRHMFEIAIQAAIGTRNHRTRDIAAMREKRDREVLRRRHHPQTQNCGRKQAAGKEAHETGRASGDSAGGVFGGVGVGSVTTSGDWP